MMGYAMVDRAADRLPGPQTVYCLDLRGILFCSGMISVLSLDPLRSARVVITSLVRGGCGHVATVATWRRMGAEW